jgi:hypothetical protein
MSVLSFGSHVKRKGPNNRGSQQHPDILREIRRLWTALNPATDRQRLGLDLLSRGLELLELDAEPELYRQEVEDLEKHIVGLEELAAFSPHVVAAFKRAHDPDATLELKEALRRALYPEQPPEMRDRLLELEGVALRIFAALEAIDAAEHEQRQACWINRVLDRPWDRGIWASWSNVILRRAAAALERNANQDGTAAALERNDGRVLPMLGAVARWAWLRLERAPTLSTMRAFLTDEEFEEQRADLERQLELELAEHAAALKARFEELEREVSLSSWELGPKPERQLELELAAKNGGAA